MKRIFVASLAVFAMLSCEKDKTPAPAPLITIECGGGNITAESSVSIDIADLPLTINAAADNVEVASYRWDVNGEEDAAADSGKYLFVSERTGAFHVTVTVASTGNKESAFNFTINVEGPYKDGVIFYSTSSAGLAFQSPDTYYDDAYSETNGRDNDMKIEDIYMYDNVIYFLTNKKIVACDAQTFKKTGQYEFSGITGPRGFIKVAGDKFYISSEKQGNKGGGIWVVEKQGDDYVSSTAAIAGTENAPPSKPVMSGGHIVVGNGSGIAVIDPATYKLVSYDKNGIEIHPERKVTDVLEGRDGYLYAVAYSYGDFMGNAPSVSTSVVKIDPDDFSFMEEAELSAGGTGAVWQVEWGGCQAHAVASLSTDDIFVMGKDGVYKYNYADKSTGLFAGMTFGYAGSAQNYMRMGVDMDNLYVPLTNYTRSTIYKYDIKSGTETIMPKQVDGDASAVSTYQFSERQDEKY